MIVNLWMVLAPGADRPYVSTSEPKTLERKEGMRVLQYELVVPDTVPVESVQRVEPKPA